MIQLPIRVIAAEFVKILSRRDGAFGLSKCTVRVSTSGFYGFPPKSYKLFKFFFTISVIFLKMGKVLISSFQVVDAWRILQFNRKKNEKYFKEFIWFWGTLSQNYRRLYGSLTMFQESWLDPCSTLEHQTWLNNQSQHDLLYGGVSLSISLDLKLTPVPYTTPKWVTSANVRPTCRKKVSTREINKLYGKNERTWISL